jgi:transcriptional regulator with XRE-family HTH domain
LSTIGTRLRAARDSQLLRQEELAERADVPVVTISRIENDRYTERPRQTTIRKLALALGVDPVWLAFGNRKGKAAA